MNNADLLFHNKADDKNYLIGKDVRFLENNFIELHFKSEDEAITLENLHNFKDTALQNEWLLSMGVIVLFGDSLKTAKIPLLERDVFAAADPLRLTSPAGRLDMTLSKGCMAELFEEMLFADKSHYYHIDKGVCDFAQKQKYQIEKMGLEKKEFKILKTQSFQSKQLFEVRMFVDDREIDSVQNIFCVKDTINKTLEFRQVLLVPECPEFTNIIDGDGFGRNVYLFKLFDLQESLKAFKNFNVSEVQQTLLESGASVMPEAQIFLGNNFGKKGFRPVQLPAPLFTKTLTEFLLAFKS